MCIFETAIKEGVNNIVFRQPPPYTASRRKPRLKRLLPSPLSILTGNRS
ncbi:hypothetical protein PO124_28565 [Bacillus licheniformis]|nr:hypothetical protein [Bacillus licheniformis]